MRKRLVWRKKGLASTVTHVPAMPGLYAIVQTREVLGLECDRDYLYVGQTSNLRRRLGEHEYVRESNPALAQYLKLNRTSADLEIWYTSELSVDELDALERQLIRSLDPQFNRKKYAKDSKP